MKELKEKQPKHLEIAREISITLINEFSGIEQHEFLEEVKRFVDADYQEKLSQIKNEAEILQEKYAGFREGGAAKVSGAY